MINFINYPAVRFKRASMATLSSICSAVYDKFKVQEDLGGEWKDACMQALEDDNKEEFARLRKQGGRILVTDDMIDILIDHFTFAEPDKETIEDFREMILKHAGYIKDIIVDYDAGCVTFKTKAGTFKAYKLTQVFEDMKLFPDIETEKRHKRCHIDSIELSKGLGDRTRVATGYAYTFGEGDKFLHSWVELYLKGKPFVIDTTRNLLMERKGYYYIRNIKGPVYKIADRTLEKEEHIFVELQKKYPWLIKLYLSNRHQAKVVYDMIEKEKLADPLYVAAKNMAAGFERMEKQAQRNKKKDNSTTENSK